MNTNFASAFDSIDTPEKLLSSVQHFDKLLFEKAIIMRDKLKSEIESNVKTLDGLDQYINKLEKQGVTPEIKEIEE